AVDADLAAIGFHQRVEHAQRGGLAGAIGPEQTGDLAVMCGETDAIDSLDLAEGLVQIVDLKHGAPRVGSFRARACRREPLRLTRRVQRTERACGPDASPAM